MMPLILMKLLFLQNQIFKNKKRNSLNVCLQLIIKCSFLPGVVFDTSMTVSHLLTRSQKSNRPVQLTQKKSQLNTTYFCKILALLCILKQLLSVVIVKLT